jgi:hypothetical protein
MPLSAPVDKAIAELRQAFPDAQLGVREDGSGGAYILLDTVDPGPAYMQRETWVGFHIAFSYPHADVYPHFVRPDLTRVDGRPAVNPGMGVQLVSWPAWDNRAALQLSRRSNRLNPRTDTATTKLVKVLGWLSTHEGG